MPLYRKKPVVIEAMQYDGVNTADIIAFCPTALDARDYLVIPTLEGDHKAEHFDFIIKGVAGEFYPCKPDIFAATYEPIGGEQE